MDFIEIGKIINTHGLKGEVKIESWSSFDDIRYQKGNKVYLLLKDGYQELTVASYRTQKGFVYVKFEEFTDINQVEKYKQSILAITKEQQGELEEGDYYQYELIGLDVYDEQQQFLGKVVNVEETKGAQNNLRIEEKSGKQFLVPFIDQFVLEIDLDENYMKIHMDEGLR